MGPNGARARGRAFAHGRLTSSRDEGRPAALGPAQLPAGVSGKAFTRFSQPWRNFASAGFSCTRDR